MMNKSTIKSYIKLISIIIFLALLFILVPIVFSVYARHKVAEKLDVGYGVSTSSAIARLEIGDKVFDIPKNHIWSRDSWRGGKVTGVNLHALLPGFEPYMSANKSEFDKPGFKKGINIHLARDNMAGSDSPKSDITRKTVYTQSMKYSKNIIEERRSSYGLLMQVLDIKDGMNEWYTGNKKNGDFYAVQCHRDHVVPYPLCTSWIEYSRQVYIEYTFSKDSLVSWQSIDDSVYDFVRKFEISSVNGDK